jgi:hypothetical protein
VQDFAWWCGQTLTDARAGLEGAKAVLTCENINGKDYWLAADAAVSDDSGVLLLPGFDEYLLGYTDRDPVLEAQHAGKICPGGNGVFFPMIVIDGQISGTWKRTIKKGTVSISRAPFRPLTKAQAAGFEAAAARYAAFLGLNLILE